MLEIKDLIIRYDRVHVLNEVSLHVEENELVTLIGANGAGKSSILRAVSGLVSIANGSISFQGQDITGKSADSIVKMGISHVPEGRMIFPDQTVHDNLIIGAYTIVRKQRKHVHELIEREFERFPVLGERRNQLAGTLSGGEQQMLAMSRALMLSPKLLLLDEPSMGLAPIMVDRVIETILSIRKQNVTILLIEQMASVALSIADRGYILQTGTIVMDGAGQDLLERPEIIYTYLGGNI
jgi:branched-chain amino acid transport system ATP-binding protein